jgi:ABC-type antimicrobial peptide transport system permease subunit
VAGVLVGFLRPVTGWLAERQQSLLAARRDRGASRRRVVGALAMQALALAGLALLAGGLLAMLVARSVAAALLPGPARPVVDTLVGGLFDSRLGVTGGIAAALTVLVAVFVMLRAASHNTEALG